MMEMLKDYAGIIKATTIALIISGLCFAWWYHGHQNYVEGKVEVQALWDADKAKRKADGDLQAAETEKHNQENQDALNRTQADLRTARRDRDAALERLRDLPDLSGGEGLLMAGGGCAAVPGVAGNPGGTGIRVERRIGSCGNSSSDPCFVRRGFFEQSVTAISDRGLTRQWAIGQKIKTSPRKR